jgi:hypothetical protein
VAQRNEDDGRRRYSFVDVLERVTDGVHVHIVGNERKPPRARAADAPDRSKPRRKPTAHRPDKR